MTRSPQRTCIGCGRVADQSSLVRVSRRPDGQVGVGRHEPGRGAWLCAGSEACFDEAARRNAFTRALRANVVHEDIAALRARLFGCS